MAKRTDWQRQVLFEIHSEDAEVRWDAPQIDKEIVKGNGTIELLHYYFYTHGYTAEKWAAAVEQALRKLCMPPFEVVAEDRYASWPKSSYFVAIVKPL
jgi:hypothetical protein